MRTILMLFFLLPCLIGCSNALKGYYKVTDQPFVSKNYFVHPEFDKFKIRRVLFAPIKNETQYPDATERLEPIFLAEWSKINQFEVLPASEEMRTEFEEFNPRMDGRFSKLRLYGFAKRFNIDAVIFTSITNYFPYEPCKIGINAQMIHTRSSVVVWALNEIYDSNMRDVETLAKQYYYERLRYEHPLLDWKIMTTSIRYFAQMVGYEVANSMSIDVSPNRMDNRIINAATIAD